ncbi:MAG TPA: heat-shock protein Hsp70 [Leucothrix mucor]|uniref:Heat-shock protein Hsp70 n=1 Tax=Leucothrix mucor TaxID=45248 RepID=A0A7V2T0K6_LEUMU|nr:heat-shock protein Hsp70 [Leucothrix mucor]
MPNETSDIIIGIDLGTTNSEVALIQDGKVNVLDIENSSKQLPSYVGLDDNGDILVGDAARNQYVLYPERTIKSIKRHMGTDEQIQLGDKQFSPQEVSAIILRRLKQVAETAAGEPITRAVITVPAFFSDAQRQATRDAGEIAGLKVERIINEPTAAALAYEPGHKEDHKILVYDLGGGTFDVSVVEMNQDVVEVKASHGDNNLGGDDFDQKLVDHIVAHLQDKYEIDATESARAMSRITRAAENTKIALSSQPYYTIEEEHLLERKGKGKPIHLSLEISRTDYEEMISGYIDTTLEAIHTTLDSAELRASDIDEILLVGGSTRTPLVQQRMDSDLNMQPRMELDPDLCVAMGAAIQAGMLSGGEQLGPILVDVTPYTFGTSAMGEMYGMEYPHCFVPLIHKNTPIPVTFSESFYTLYDDQEAVDVRVYQGEEQDAMKNTEIGGFKLENLKNLSAGSPIVVTFSLDINGILSVSTVEKKSGTEESLVIDNAISRFQEDELEQAKTALKNLMQDKKDSPETAEKKEKREHVKALALLEKIRKLLPSLEGDDSEDAIELIETLDNAIKANDKDKIEQAMDELSDLLYYLEPNA